MGKQTRAQIRSKPDGVSRLIATARAIVKQQKAARAAVGDGWPTDEDFDKFAKIQAKAAKTMQMLERVAEDRNVSRRKTLVDLHWQLQMITAVPIEKAKPAIRAAESLYRAMSKARN